MRRGSVLLSVLIVVVIAALTGATAMYVAQAQASTASLTLRRTQARALAWSGVQAAMAEMAEQREALLDGGEPVLTEEWDLFQDGAARGIVRLSVFEGGTLCQSEAARLNLNTATASMLIALGLEEETANAMVAARAKSRFESVEALLEGRGVTASDLRSPAGPAEGASGAEHPREIGSLLSVWSFDPNIQSGFGPGASDHRGNLRVNLDLEWSDSLKSAVEDRFGEGSSAALKTLLDGGATFKSMADVVAAIQRLNVDKGMWPELLDALTTSPDPYIPGRIDINRAPEDVIACIPGIDREAARTIVEKRAGLDAATLRSHAWPVTEGILTAEQFREAVDHVTSRSLQWRVRIEAGVAAADERGESAATAELRDRIVVEAVIDVASERPRVAYLRDITMLEAATSLYESLLAGGEDEPLEEPGDEAPVPDPARPSVARRPAAAGSAEPGGPRAAAAWEAPAAEFSPDTPDSGDLDPMTAEFPRMGPSDLDRLKADPPDTPPPAGIDRRLGRWTTGKGVGR